MKNLITTTLMVISCISCGTRHKVSGDTDHKVRVSVTKSCKTAVCEDLGLSDEQFLQCIQIVCNLDGKLVIEAPSEAVELPENLNGVY